MGRIIIPLDKQYFNAVVYTIKFSTKKIPQGIYFVRTARDSFSTTAKLEIVK
jgi:hypothetical protein